MEIRFNTVQKELIQLAKDQGFLTVEDFKKYYTSPITIKANIERFIVLGYIKNSNTPDKFDYVGSKK